MTDYTPTTDEVWRGYIENTGEYGDLLEGWFGRWLAEVERAAAEKAWDEGQKSGLKYTERMRAAYKIGRPELPGPPSQNPYRAAALGLTAGQEGETE